MDGLLAVGGLEEGGSSYVKDLSVGGKKSMSVYQRRSWLGCIRK
jgi:hypothetical protein